MTEKNKTLSHRGNRRFINEEPIGSGELNPIVGYAKETPLSLFDACTSLTVIVDDILNYVAIAMRTTPDQPANDLTRDESAAIRLYTMEWSEENASLYLILNRALRTDNRSSLRPWYKYLKLLLTALVKIPCTHRQTVWCGIQQNVTDVFPPGAKITWWSFSSCATKPSVLDNEFCFDRIDQRTLFAIDVFNARDISAHSYTMTENEVLLLPGMHMEVQEQSNPTASLHIIHLKQKILTTMSHEPSLKDNKFDSSIDISAKHHWYQKRKYYILFSLLMAIGVVAIILGCVLGTRSSSKSSVEPSTNSSIDTTLHMFNSTPTTQSSGPSGGICATAQWMHSGVTVAGGLGQGQALNQLNSPDGLFVEGSGSLYVVDSGNNRILKWDDGDSNGYIVAGGNQPGNSSGLLNYPVDVVVDNNGTMYISDFNNNRVQEWFQGASSGQTVLTGFKFTGIAQDSEGSLYTSDWSTNQVTKWHVGNTTGQVLAFGMNSPDRMYVDRNKSIYVADRGNHRVVKILAGTTQTLVVAGASLGNGTDQLSFPRSVTTDPSGNVYVADTGNNRIVRWLVGATSGTVVIGNRGAGSDSDQLNTPTDLQFDRDGNLYVSDSGNNRVQKFYIVTNSC